MSRSSKGSNAPKNEGVSPVPKPREPLSWEEAFAVARADIQQRKEQGLPVAFSDPSVIATATHLLQIGQRNHNAAGVEAGAATPGRRNRNVPNQRSK